MIEKMNIQCIRKLQSMMFSSCNKVNRFNTIYSIIAECNKGQPKLGVERGPRSILENMNLSFDDHFEVSQNDFNQGKGYCTLSNITKQLIDKHYFTMTFGGDHSISSSIIPHYFNMYREDLHLVWIDAHGDLHTHETSESKNTHGMVLGQILGETPNHVQNIDYVPNKGQITLIGTRDLDHYEIEYCMNHNIDMYSTDKIQRLEFPVGFNIKNKSIYVSFDVDALCPSILDSTGTLVENGLKLRDIRLVMDNLKMNNNRIVGCDIVEFNPSIGNPQKSLKSINKCIYSIIS